jgi:hypothetical protein
MKIVLMVLVVLASAIGVGRAGVQTGSQRWIPACTSKPEECQVKIVPLTAEERQRVASSRAREKAANDAWEKAAKDDDATTEAIIKAHHMEGLPAVHSTHFGSGSV